MTEERQGDAPKHLRALLVEDHKLIRMVLLQQLEQLGGFEVDAVGDGKEALDALDRAAYDVVLLDCYMPDMDGFATAAEIRKREAGHQRIPIIALTASEHDAQKCLDAGMDEVLPKPVESERLKSCIDKWVCRSGHRGPVDPPLSC